MVRTCSSAARSIRAGTTARLIRRSALTANDFELIELGWRGEPCSAPGAPQELSSSVSGQLVQLSWTPATATGVLHYVLEAGTAPGQTNIGALPLGSGSSFSVMAPRGVYHDACVRTMRAA